jgi:choline dehydrogenase
MKSRTASVYSSAMNNVDFVIVGAGAAGCVLANRLSVDPSCRVLLLEAGGSDRSPLISAPGGMLPIMLSGIYSWHYRTAPQRQLNARVITMPRGKVLGGSSSTNGMVYSRGAPQDYDRWRDLGNEGWSYADVLPYFRRLESHPLGPNPFHGTTGPLRISRPGVHHPLSRAFVAAAQEIGSPLNEDTDGAEREGVGPLDLMVWRGRRSSASTAYLRPALHRANLRVITHAQAVRVLFDGKRANGVEYQRRGLSACATAAKEVVISCGAIQSPQLLMLSGIGRGSALQQFGLPVVHDLPGVGQGLQDHLAISVKYTATQPITMLRYLNPWRGAIALTEYLLLRRGPFANPGFETVAFLKSRPDLAQPDLKLQFIMALYRHNGRELIPEHGFFTHASLTTTESFGSVTLTSANPLDPPLVDQNYLDSPQDRQSLREAVRVIRRICEGAPFDPYRGAELEPGPAVRSDEEIDAFVREKAEADFHSVGTCRMGSDPLAVVDNQLRVHGLAGLRVVDASVMPRLVGSGTCIPTIMIAEKAADMILDQSGASHSYHQTTRGIS